MHPEKSKPTERGKSFKEDYMALLNKSMEDYLQLSHGVGSR